jgi:hypothetical protein
MNDVESLEKLVARRSPLTRYAPSFLSNIWLLLHKGLVRRWGIAKTNQKWDAIQLKTCKAIEQKIEIPEFGIKESHSHQFYFSSHAETATIYVVREKSPSLRLLYLGDALAKHFDAPSLGPSITQILRSPVDELSGLLLIWNVPSLPVAWGTALRELSPAYGLSNETQMNEDSQDLGGQFKISEISSVTARQIMKTIEVSICSQGNVDGLL